MRRFDAILWLLRNAFVVERLPHSDEPTRARRRSGIADLLFARERLPAEPTVVRIPRQRWSIFTVERLEQLPPAPVHEHRRGGFARSLFAIERLEQLPPGPVHERHRRAGLAQLLFGVERLDAIPPAPHARRRGGRWLRWLFGIERLESSRE